MLQDSQKARRTQLAIGKSASFWLPTRHPQPRCTLNIFHISADGCLPHPSSTDTIYYYYGKIHPDVTYVVCRSNHIHVADPNSYHGIVYMYSCRWSVSENQGEVYMYPPLIESTSNQQTCAAARGRKVECAYSCTAVQLYVVRCTRGSREQMIKRDAHGM
jgi:hypothetical protein